MHRHIVQNFEENSLIGVECHDWENEFTPITYSLTVYLGWPIFSVQVHLDGVFLFGALFKAVHTNGRASSIVFLSFGIVLYYGYIYIYGVA